jgi:hypothetical protein
VGIAGYHGWWKGEVRRRRARYTSPVDAIHSTVGAVA